MKWNVHLENPYKWTDTWDCGACREHLEFAKKHNMLVLVDEKGDIQGVTFNCVMDRDVKTIKIGDKNMKKLFKKIHKGKCIVCGKTRRLNRADRCFWCYDKEVDKNGRSK